MKGVTALGDWLRIRSNNTRYIGRGHNTDICVSKDGKIWTTIRVTDEQLIQLHIALGEHLENNAENLAGSSSDESD